MILYFSMNCYGMFISKGKFVPPISLKYRYKLLKCSIERVTLMFRSLSELIILLELEKI